MLCFSLTPNTTLRAVRAPSRATMMMNAVQPFWFCWPASKLKKVTMGITAIVRPLYPSDPVKVPAAV